MSARGQIVCGKCGQINRLPADRPMTAAHCGSCHQPIFSGRPIEVDEAGFARHVAHSDIPLLVDVWAPWCGPCRAMAPMFERAASELEPKVRLLKLNADTAPSVSARFGISGIPTLLLMLGCADFGCQGRQEHRCVDHGRTCPMIFILIERKLP